MRQMVACLFLCTSLVAQGKVAWRTWGPAAFAEAKAAGRPVLVDAEATWCHWCHVMEAKTYGDSEVATLIARTFVPVKADIDLHPDAQELYADIGWPGTTLYAPDGTVLWRHRGYVAKEAFLPVLQRVAAEAHMGRYTPWRPEEGEAAVPAPEGDPLALARGWVDRAFDEDLGGWGEQKYPIAMNVEELFRRAHRGDSGARFRALYTLSQQRSITDPVWGGLFQYSAGPDWHAVHFEKLATLQAGYLENLAEAWRATGDEDWKRDAAQVVGFLRRFMQHPEGGWSATVDADLGGHGAVRPRMLGKAYYALGNRARLRAGLPRTDRRRYAQVQGLLASAYARLAGVLEGPALLREARAAMVYVDAKLKRGQGFLHAEGQEGYYLQDQVAILKAHLALYEVTGEETWLSRAESLAGFIDGAFRNPQGLFLSRSGAEGLPASGRVPVDDNLALARALAKLQALRGVGPWGERAAAVAAALCTPAGLDAQGRWLGDAILLLEELKSEAPHLVIVGDPADPRTQALTAAAHRGWMPGTAVLRHEPTRLEPINPELSFPRLGMPAAFLCSRGSCSLPLTTPESLTAELARRRR